MGPACGRQGIACGSGGRCCAAGAPADPGGRKVPPFPCQVPCDWLGPCLRGVGGARRAGKAVVQPAGGAACVERGGGKNMAMGRGRLWLWVCAHVAAAPEPQWLRWEELI